MADLQLTVSEHLSLFLCC